jgi:hypothetical protein
MLKKLISKHKDEILENNNIDLKVVVKPKRRSTIVGLVTDYSNQSNQDDDTMKKSKLTLILQIV